MNVLPSAPLRAAVAAAAVALAACSSMPGMGSGSSSMLVPVKAQLDAKQEVPPNGSPATGMLEGNFNKATSLLTWKVTYQGLSGPASMAHFHGPAPMGQNAGIVVPFANARSPIEGSATLTPAQAADLMAGKWYVNVHTAANPGGEIRGQVMAGGM